MIKNIILFQAISFFLILSMEFTLEEVTEKNIIENTFFKIISKLTENPNLLIKAI
jgi:hypothetical protein